MKLTNAQMKIPVTIFGVDYGKEDTTIITVIDKGKFTEHHLTINKHYQTIDDWFKQNAERHLERAIAYASAGYPDRFYEGSMRKAIRNFKIADDFKVPEFFKPYVDALSNAIADNILNGNNNAMSKPNK